MPKSRCRPSTLVAAGLAGCLIGGLGGCPFAPGAAGNVATEDVVYMLERAGIATGLDLERLIETNRWLGGVMEKDLPAMVGKSGGFPKPTAGQNERNVA